MLDLSTLTQWFKTTQLPEADVQKCTPKTKFQQRTHVYMTLETVGLLLCLPARKACTMFAFHWATRALQNSARHPLVPVCTCFVHKPIRLPPPQPILRQ